MFHYRRKWLLKATSDQMDRTVANLKVARQLDLPPLLAMPLRVMASMVAISVQLDAHVPVRPLAIDLLPGFAEAA